MIVVAAVLTTISTVAYFASKFVIRVFGNIPLQQVLFNLSPKGAGDVVNAIFQEYGSRILNYSGKTLLIIILVWIITILALKRRTLREVIFDCLKFLKRIATFLTFRICTLVLLVFLCVFFSRDVEHRFHVRKFLSQTDSPFVAQNYAALNPSAIVHTDGRKRNLIVIMLESMETGFRDAAVYGENLIPELEAIEKEGLPLKGYRKTPGGYFTIDGMSAQLLGMPLMQLPTDIHDVGKNKLFGSFLSRVPGIFNVLKNDGYMTAGFLGTSKEYTHMGDFLRVHGISEGFFAEDWERLGYPLTDSNRGRWDYSDDFLFARFEEWLSKPKNSSFAAFIGTIDTHFPVGFTPVTERVKGNHQESVRHASRLVGRFLTWAKTQPWYKDTTIYIAGDHQWQDFEYAFTKLTKKDTNRGIYSVFLNSARTDLRIRSCGFSAMDIAPTILNAMGIDFTSDFHGQPSHIKLGLGQSLFADGENLVCRYGVNELTQKLREYSAFYNTLQ